MLMTTTTPRRFWAFAGIAIRVRIANSDRVNSDFELMSDSVRALKRKVMAGESFALTAN